MQNFKDKYVRQIKQFVEDYREKFWEDPIISEIAWSLGLSEDSAEEYLKYMNDSGIIEYDVNSEIQHEYDDSEENEAFGASEYIDLKHLSQTDNERGISIDRSFMLNSNFYVKAPDDSMSEANIEMGDLVLIKEQDHAEPGQIIYATVENKSMLRRYFPEPQMHRIRLHPDNVMLKDIYVDQCEIEGVVLKIIKNLPLKAKNN